MSIPNYDTDDLRRFVQCIDSCKKENRAIETSWFQCMKTCMRTRGVHTLYTPYVYTPVAPKQHPVTLQRVTLHPGEDSEMSEQSRR
jgi:hypothetical protein